MHVDRLRRDALRADLPFLRLGLHARLRSMERKMMEQHLLQAEEAVLSGESHIVRQRQIIRDMEQRGHDVTMAKDLLRTFLALQQEHVAHRDRLRLELGRDHQSVFRST